MWNELSISRLGVAFLLSFGVSWLAWRAKSLSVSGAVAAFLMGGIVFGIGGWWAASVLLTFFISSSLISRLFSKRKENLHSFVVKGSQRDAGQVLANGGFGTLCLFASLFFPASPLPFVAFCGSFAAANADTWATELGVLSPQPPRLLIGGKVVERGTSGGVTPLGLFASLLGAMLIAGVGTFFFGDKGSLLLAVSLAGFAGSLFDSWLGVSFQAIYTCPTCGKETERHPLHGCGSPTSLIRGLSWLDNDRVNFACTVFGGLVAVGLYRII